MRTYLTREEISLHRPFGKTKKGLERKGTFAHDIQGTRVRTLDLDFVGELTYADYE